MFAFIRWKSTGVLRNTGGGGDTSRASSSLSNDNLTNNLTEQWGSNQRYVTLSVSISARMWSDLHTKSCVLQIKTLRQRLCTRTRSIVHFCKHYVVMHINLRLHFPNAGFYGGIHLTGVVTVTSYLVQVLFPKYANCHYWPPKAMQLSNTQNVYLMRCPDSHNRNVPDLITAGSLCCMSHRSLLWFPACSYNIC